ncbi:MAG: DNA repair protein RadC [Bacteroidales bacterium]|nr:DNA repair protein RadC [Bacteroidales bacterium]
MKIKELCKDERPREKLISKGAESLSNAELLAILLRTGHGNRNALDVGRDLLINAEEKLNRIAAMPLERLCSVNGIGPDKAVTITAAFELGRRCAGEKIIDSHTPISSPKAVFRLLLPTLRHLGHEECWVLFLNRANFLISKEKITSGGIDSTIIDNKTIIRKAIEKKASGIIIAHNHPSGSAMPGQADINATMQLEKALKTCDISLLDHVIIAEDSYYSFADETLVKC